MSAKHQDLFVTKGDTFERIVRWETKPFQYAAISTISQTAPVQITTQASHGLTDGWRVAIIDVVGMVQINSKGKGQRDSDFVPCTYVSPTVIALNDVSSINFDAYVSGGAVKSYTPIDLTSYTAAMQIRDTFGGNILASIDTTSGITLDPTPQTITLLIDRATTEAFTFTSGVYDLQLIDGSNKETTILKGQFFVKEEVTV